MTKKNLAGLLKAWLRDHVATDDRFHFSVRLVRANFDKIDQSISIPDDPELRCINTGRRVMLAHNLRDSFDAVGLNPEINKNLPGNRRPFELLPVAGTGVLLALGLMDADPKLGVRFVYRLSQIVAERLRRSTSQSSE